MQVKIPTSAALCAALVLSFVAGRASMAFNMQAVVVSNVEDSQPGWTWSGMVEADDDAFSGGTARAGGVGSYGMYTFTGTGVQVFGFRSPDIVVDGHHHKSGKLRVSIDGHEKTVTSVNVDDREYNSSLADIEGLSSGIHVLQVEPVGGWAAVDYIRVTSGDATVAAPESAGDLGKVAIFDPLDNFDFAFSKSEGIGLDTTNAQYMGNDMSRLTRSSDTKQYIGYKYPHMSGFIVRFYTKQSYKALSRIVQIFSSPDLGNTSVPVEYTSVPGFDGGGDGGWTGYDLVPKSALPADTNSIFIVINSGSGVAYDPEVSQVAIKTPK
jgi:hypothetical protein